MSIQTTCIRCGAEVVATAAEVRAGPSWRFCPHCRKEARSPAGARREGLHNG
jgi:hypothetical protein